MPKITYAILKRSLRGFEQPDTSSPIEVKLTPGRYRVLEEKQNYPTPETDYLLLEVPSLGDEETWICSRWKDTQYVNIETKEVVTVPLTNFEQDSLAIDESSLVELLPQFYNFGYDLDVARYPYEIEGFRAPLAPPYTNNCCTFVEALVAKAWENAHQLTWGKSNHAQMMIFSKDDYFSPVTCLLDSEIAIDLDTCEDGPAPWSVVQGWRNQWNSGHTFIILGHHLESDRVLTLESNASYGIGGVGYRMLGHLKDFHEPPTNWWENDQLWTWERMKSVYRYRKVAQLKVKNVKWMKLP